MRHTMVHCTYYLYVFILAAFLAGACSVTSNNSSWEPDDIVIRNNSGRNLQVVSLSEAVDDRAQGFRYGSISPVLMGADQTFTRPASRPPLPSVIVIKWTDDKETSYSRNINLRKLFEKDKINDPHALVVNILPAGMVSVIVE